MFFIENIDQKECFPTNKVEIYNRWGVLVYDTDQYDNGLHAFKGYSEGRVTVNKGEQLPTGTYFYIVYHTDAKGQSFEDQGYLYLSR